MAETKSSTARCDECAFTEGTQAHGTSHTRLLAQLCVMGRSEFTCHVDDRPCRGWAAAVQAGESEPEGWKRKVSALCMEALNDEICDLKQGKRVPVEGRLEKLYAQIVTLKD